MICRAARTLPSMPSPSSWPSCFDVMLAKILTPFGGNVLYVGIVHRQLIFKDHFLIIDDRFLNFFGAAPERYIMCKAVISLGNTQIRKYTNDRCEVFFCSQLFVRVFVLCEIVFFGSESANARIFHTK